MRKILVVLLFLVGCVIMCSSCEKSYDQLTGAKKGDQIAIIKTSMGDITVKLFPKYAPKAVENFTTHAKDGYYDGVIFHRVINDFMIQGGDPEGTGRGGQSIWEKSFEDEITPELHNIRGALSMANAGRNTNGSQFFIVQNTGLLEDTKKIFNDAIKDKNYQYRDRFGGSFTLRDNIPLPFMQYYVDNGGAPHLDGSGLDTGYQHTVFGQVIEGMDVVDKIAAVETNSERPIEDVVINSIEITTFQK